MKSLIYILLLAMSFGALSLATPEIMKYFERQSLEVIGVAPTFELQVGSLNQEGSLSSESLKGKVWVFGTFFTSCPVTCPTLLSDLKNALQKFSNRTDFAIVSASVDPTYDTTDIIKQFISKRNFIFSNWYFLTGSQEAVQALVVDGFKIGTRQEPLLHSNRFMLVDRTGNIRGSYLGTESLDLAKLVEDVEKLL